MNLSQEEIDALLKASSGGAGDDEPDTGETGQQGENWELSFEEIDILGEVGNMCMGAVANTMNMVLDRRVNITTPTVTVLTTAEVLAYYQVPFIVVEVEFIEGISGRNLLLLKEPDAALITDIMLGGDGSGVEPDMELNEMHMSAVSEIMNQMIGSSATAMSSIIDETVNITPPISNRVSGANEANDIIDYNEMVIMISFEMEIEGLLNSQLLQLMPFQIGKDLAKTLMERLMGGGDSEPVPPPPPPPPVAAAPVAPQPEVPSSSFIADSSSVARPAEFQSFGGAFDSSADMRDISLVADIPVQVSVELGKTRKEISEILRFSVGTYIMLDRAVGEAVEVFANGKLIARGEVVSVSENYGIRILEVIRGK